MTESKPAPQPAPPTPAATGERAPSPAARPDEVGGPKGPEPTRYGDWQIKGRVSDF
ncbi:MAG: DUF1674 domain-containing protein [Alphaproteobacteria bacterium]|nr:DUF1674 domain-containing protein [Alphaproteobacteria bacterium]